MLRMSSITTAFPSGVVQHWCLSPIFGFSLDPISKCTAANVSAEFQTVCCNGNIIDTTGRAFGAGPLALLNVDNIVCCVLSGTYVWDNDSGTTIGSTTCSSGSPTPIASLAATNTRNAALYEIDFTNLPTSLFSSNDMTASGTPNCLWLYTASGVSMATVTVPAVEDVASPTSTMSSIPSATTTSPTSRSQASTSATPSTKSSSSHSSLWKSGFILGLLVSCMPLL